MHLLAKYSSLLGFQREKLFCEALILYVTETKLELAEYYACKIRHQELDQCDSQTLTFCISRYFSVVEGR